jgi:hypothetical protein
MMLRLRGVILVKSKKRENPLAERFSLKQYEGSLGAEKFFRVALVKVLLSDSTIVL